MKNKTNEQLIAENEELRQRVAAMESNEAERKRIEEEHRQAVEALQQKEQQLCLLLETAPFGRLRV